MNIKIKETETDFFSSECIISGYFFETVYEVFFLE